MWPFRTENRSVDYAEAISEARLEAAANAAEGTASGIAAVGVVTGLYARAMAQAEIANSEIDLPADVLAAVGRSVVIRGEALVDLKGGALASSWDVVGTGADPMSWRYRLELPGPSGNRSHSRRCFEVVHIRPWPDLASPWRSSSPIETAGTTRDMLVRLERALRDEGGIPVQSLLTVPSGTTEPQKIELRKDLRRNVGKISLVESVASGWGQGSQAAPRLDWKPQRLGPEYPASAVALRAQATENVLALYGVPPGILGSGAAAREGWRTFLHGALGHLGRILEAELRRKGSPLAKVGFDSLMASDLSGRARAFQSLVNGGLSIEQAAAQAGLLISDD